jgi:hypothetical protein
VISVAEDSTSPATSDALAGPGADVGGGADRLPDRTRITSTVVGHLSDQARRTASAAKARRMVNGDGEPGVLDLTPLRELLSELVAELGRLRLRDRVARALRQAADIIDTQPPND